MVFAYFLLIPDVVCVYLKSRSIWESQQAPNLCFNLHGDAGSSSIIVSEPLREIECKRRIFIKFPHHC